MVNIEKEVKVLDVNVQALRRQLKSLKATKIFEGTMRARVYATQPLPTTKDAIVRIRQVKRKVFLTYKGPSTSKNIREREELEVEIEDFVIGCQIFERLGLICTLDLLKHRTEYALSTTKFAIDTIPKIPPFLEIEGTNKSTIHAAARRLGFTPADCINISLNEVYARYGQKIPLLRRRFL